MFGGAWTACQLWWNLNVGVATAVAGAAMALVGFVLAPWASERPTPPEVATRTSGQVIVGEIPAAAVAFQPRPQLLDAIAATPQSNSVVIAALTGTRGVGKTQLAAEYTRRVIDHEWPVVVWLAAEIEDQIVDGWAKLADEVGVRAPESDSVTAAHAALEWLRRHDGPCLVVYDNADDPDVVARWAPTLGHTQVMITTVSLAFEGVGRTVDVEVFTADEARTYLRQRTGLPGSNDAGRLAKELDRLPLALAQAAALIGPRRRYVSYPDYLQALRTVPVTRLLGRVRGDPYPRGVAQALHLAVDQLRVADATGYALHLLELLAVLSPDGVPSS
jgi:hypothetical protein